MNKHTTQTSLLCPVCGNVFQIMRKSSKQKERFHKKVLYCYICKEYTNHIELKNMDELIAMLDLNQENLTEEEQKVYGLIKKR